MLSSRKKNIIHLKIMDIVYFLINLYLVFSLVPFLLIKNDLITPTVQLSWGVIIFTLFLFLFYKKTLFKYIKKINNKKFLFSVLLITTCCLLLVIPAQDPRFILPEIECAIFFISILLDIQQIQNGNYKHEP